MIDKEYIKEKQKEAQELYADLIKISGRKSPLNTAIWKLIQELLDAVSDLFNTKEAGKNKDWGISDVEFFTCHCGSIQFQICDKFIMCSKCLRKYKQKELMKILTEKGG